MKIYLVIHIEGKCMPYTTVLCSIGKLQAEYISTCNRYLQCFSIAHSLWVPVRQQWPPGLVLLQGHLECRLVAGPENRCCNQLWAVWCWHVLTFWSLRLSICEGRYWCPPCRVVVSLGDNRHKASTTGPQCSVAGINNHGATRLLFSYRLFYELIY